jgi:hypothetical protein
VALVLNDRAGQSGPAGFAAEIAVLDILPTGEVWERADARFALAFWPWSLLASNAPEPLTPTLIAPLSTGLSEKSWGGRGREVFRERLNARTLI